MTTAATVVAVVLGAHAVLKLAAFALPYRRRRAALDRAYDGRTTATARGDVVVLGIAVAAVVLLVVAGMAPVSFLVGLWAGASIIQVWFHRFHAPLDAEHAPPWGLDSPIRTMSYAIQAAPWRAWRESALLSAAVVVALVVLVA